MAAIEKVGGEFLVNTSTVNGQYNPAVTSLVGGSFVVTWMDFSVPRQYTIMGQVYNPAGAKVGGEFIVPTNTANYAGSPSVIGLAAGGFVVSWQDQIQTGNLDINIKSQIFTPNGAKSGGVISVNANTNGNQYGPQSTDLTNGNYVVTWYDFSGTLGDNSAASVKAQIFSPNGVKIGTEFLVNTTIQNHQYAPTITKLNGGKFVISWTDWSASQNENFDLDIRAQIFNPDGSKSGTEFVVNTTTSGIQTYSSVSRLTNGGFVVAWQDRLEDGEADIKAQVYSETGLRIGGEILVNANTGGNQLAPVVVGLASGDFVVGWTDDGGTLGDASGHSVKAQVFSADGTRLGGEFLVNTNTANAQDIGGIAARANGGFIVAWSDASRTLGDTNPSAVKAQIFSVNNDPVITSDGGGATATIVVSENTTAVTTVAASDIDPGATASFAISGGGDAALFSIDGTTGALRFIAAPDYETPADQNYDNVYEVTVSASDGTLSDSQTLNVEVSNVVEALNLVGTEGNDTLTGGPEADMLSGLGGNDMLIGSAGNDTLDGGSGDDRLSGEGGVNMLTGGTGNDSYYSDNAADPIVESDGGGSDALFSSVTVNLADFVEDLYLTGAGDIDGWVSDSNHALDNVLTGNAGNNGLYSSAGNDTLYGGGGNDTLDGGAGDDALSGEAGVNVMTGGTGNDSYFSTSAADAIVESDGGGSDALFSSVTVDLPDYVEDLYLTGTGDIAGWVSDSNHAVDNVLTGNTGDNQLYGSAGNDTLYGGAGNDSLGGGAGDDALSGEAGVNVMTGGVGNDSYFSTSAADAIVESDGGGSDALFSSVTVDLADYVEDLYLTGTGDIAGWVSDSNHAVDNVLTGNAGNNGLYGSAGNDTLYGGGGDDTLGGGAGDDALSGEAGVNVMTGGAGNDSYYSDNAADAIFEAADGGADTLFASVTGVLTNYVENLTLTGMADIDGWANDGNHALDNVLTGNAGNNGLYSGVGNDTVYGGSGNDAVYGGGGNDLLDGGLGTDTLIGNAGNDTYVVDTAADVVTETGGQGIDLARASINYALSGNVENLVLTGNANISGTGTSGSNIIAGNEGDNTLDGRTGADTLSGGLGNDTYYFDNAGDVIIENAGQGTDQVNSSISFTAGQDIESIVLVGTAAIGATGNASANTLTGNRAANLLDGGAGADEMTGGAGNDSYVVDNAGDVVTEIGGQGTDTVLAGLTWTISGNVENLILTGSGDISANGNSGNNTLTGNGGNNTLNGRTGADLMYGGAGDDTYYVDNAGDRVYEVSGEGVDTVRAAVTYSAVGQWVEIIVLTGSAMIDATGQGLDNRISGNAGVNTLNGGSGNDTLDGGSGADILIGGNGADAFVFLAGSGADTVSDFHPSQNDTIDINAYSHGVVGGGGISISQNGTDAVIDLGGGNTVTVLNSLATASAFLSHIVW